MAPAWRRSVFVLSCLVFLGLIFFRGGPNPAETDAHADTGPATAISQGDLAQAERETAVPNPPGYPLLTAPLVAAFRPWVGSPRWCDDKPIPALLRRGAGASYFRSILDPCGAPVAGRGGHYPVWYRSQALLVVTAWIALLAGAVALLRASGGGRDVGELVLAGLLLALPATTDAVAESFHPQDLMSVGFSCGAVALALRRRWWGAGLLIGTAFVCKQFAVLPLVAVVAAAPGWRPRLRLLVPAGLLTAAAVLPFYLADSTATVHALSGTYVEGVGVVKTPTLIGLLGVLEQRKLELARDLPIVAAAAMALWAWRRAGERLLAPVALSGLVLACLATRLLFEVTVLNYYFLAVGVLLVACDILRRRPPLRSLAWVVVTRVGITWLEPRGPAWSVAVVFALAALAPVVMGLAAVPRRPVVAPLRRETPAVGVA